MEDVAELNEHLVKLLMQRDALHMQQDSLLVDVEDQLKHRQRTDLPLTAYLHTGTCDTVAARASATGPTAAVSLLSPTAAAKRLSDFFNNL